jgi:acyl-CoA synthetase (AMP-forming)/AMP-acid ligase II
LKPDAKTNAQAILKWAKENIAPYKAPRYIEIVDELPRNPTMKVDKKLLKNRYKDLKIDKKDENNRVEDAV